MIRPLSQRGTQAVVVLVRRRDDGTERAIKIYLDVADVVDVDALRSLQGGDPRHVVRFTVDTDGVHVWEIMEYLPYGSLEELRRERPRLFLTNAGRLSEQALIRIVTELADAIAYLGERGVMHRDIKPANVLVRHLEPLDLVLADFGVSVAATGTNLGSFAGTNYYMAPEADANTVTRASDWFALGLIVYELIVGRHLFANPDGSMISVHQWRSELHRGDYDLAAIEDDRRRLLVRGLLIRDYEQRWKHAQVRTWLAGGSPPVAASSASEAPAAASAVRVRPFVFEGRTFRDPVQLTQTLVTGWESAARHLAGRGKRDLVDFLASCGSLQGDVDVIANSPDPDIAMLHLQCQYMPERAPRFRGRSLDGDGLQSAAEQASRGGTAAAEWIRAMRRSQALYTLAQYRADDVLAVGQNVLDESWAVINAQILGGDGKTLGLPSDVVDRIHRRLVAWEAQVLFAALDPSAARRIAEEARGEAERGAGEEGWAVRLAAIVTERRSTRGAEPGWGILARDLLPIAREVSAELRRQEAARRDAERERHEQEQAETERERQQAEAEVRRARVAGNARDAWRHFGIWLVPISLFSLLAGFAAAAGRSPDEILPGALQAGIPLLIVSLGVAAWRTFNGRIEGGLSPYLWWASFIIALGDVVPSALRHGHLPHGDAIVFALFLAIGFIALVVTEYLASHAVDAADAPRRSTRFSGLAGFLGVCAWIALAITVGTASGWVGAMITGTGFRSAEYFPGFAAAVAEWLIEVGPGDVFSSPESGWRAAMMTAAATLVLLGIVHRVDRRRTGVRAGVAAIACGSGILIALLSPWAFVFGLIIAVGAGIAAGIVAIVIGAVTG
ncbi:protein kinase domain-containing protein [Microbacterium karelineae]|uniref:protein kinase domain-containing protein n=1 Tax=Microbacterium karelineae TaxID=2654283 RepID=UPI001E3101CC|nr:protein kinase [Microbacterium karelineae]